MNPKPFRAVHLVALLAALTFTFAGCNSDDDSRTFSDEDDVDNTAPIVGHDHAHAPHDGLYAVFGDEKFHGEFVFNEETGDVTVYILGSDGTTPHPIDEPQVAVEIDLSNGEYVEMTLPAARDAGDPEGKSSRFIHAVPHRIGTGYVVRIIATIDGEEYTGEVLRDEHGHEHSHEDGPEHSHEESGEHAHSHDDDDAQDDESETDGEETEQ